VAAVLGAAGGTASWASAPAGGDDPAARGVQLLQAREGALDSQAALASATARRRGRLLYRLLLHDAAERRSGPVQVPGAEVSGGAPPGGRAIALAVAVLARDLEEAAALRDELERVREERRSVAAAADVMASSPGLPEGAAPATLRVPVAGSIVTSWGVARDQATGGWSFRTAEGYATVPGSAVVAPAEGRVARVTDDVAGGRAVVLAHPGGLTTVLAGLATVAVAPRDLVRAGGVVGTAGARVQLEVWRGRTPIDPASLLAAGSGRGPRATAARAR